MTPPWPDQREETARLYRLLENILKETVTALNTIDEDERADALDRIKGWALRGVKGV